MLNVSFTVEMAPRGQGRPRLANIGGHARAYKDPNDSAHERTLAALADQYRPRGLDGKAIVIDCPVRVEVTAVMPRPQSLCQVSKRTGEPLQPPSRRWHTSKPDLDNVVKAVLDALRDWWRDDCIVVLIVAAKRVAAFGEAPHYDIMISEVAQ